MTSFPVLISSRLFPQVRVGLMAEFGEVRSFLADQYPECRAASAAVWAERRPPADDSQDEL